VPALLEFFLFYSLLAGILSALFALLQFAVFLGESRAAAKAIKLRKTTSEGPLVYFLIKSYYNRKKA
jgi:hypothetical protein